MRRQQDNITIDLRHTWCEIVDLRQMFKDTGEQRKFVKAITFLSFRISKRR